jgi:hypothetical protein
MRTVHLLATAIAVVVLGAGATASAQTFNYGTREDVKEIEWKASAEAGVLVTTGNSRTTTGSATAKASRKDGNNKFEAEANGTYARSTIRVAAEDPLDDNETVDREGEIVDQGTTSAKNAALKLRYDRFLTDNNSLYASATIGFDTPAGKDLYGGGQVGYSRQLYKTDRHEAKAEVGYDFTYEDLIVGDSVSIHSARFFVGYKGALHVETAPDGAVTPTTTVDASIESLHNVNTLDVPTGDLEAGPFEDTRINGSVGLTTKLLDNISFAISFAAKFDNVPAPAKAIDVPYDPTFVPAAEKLDTTTKASLIINFF